VHPAQCTGKRQDVQLHGGQAHHERRVGGEHRLILLPDPESPRRRSSAAAVPTTAIDLLGDEKLKQPIDRKSVRS